MLIDAVVLAGGRSSRLGSVAKALLVVEGQSLLERTVSAAMTVSREALSLLVAELPRSLPASVRSQPPGRAPATPFWFSHATCHGSPARCQC